MAKLRNYEVEAIVEEVEERLLEELKKSKSKEIEEYNKVMEEVGNAEEEAFKEVTDAFTKVAEKYSHLEVKFYPPEPGRNSYNRYFTPPKDPTSRISLKDITTSQKIRRKVVLGGLNGDVNDLVSKLVKEFKKDIL